jgi:DNA-directed RNA polymerase specialized sigma24 family protein
MSRIDSADGSRSAEGVADGSTGARGGDPPGKATVTTSGVRVDPRRAVMEAYDAHGDFVWHLVARVRVEDAEGIHQEVFVHYYLYTGKHGVPDEPRAWLAKVTVCQIFKDLRRRYRHPRARDVDLDTFPDGGLDPERLFGDAEVAQLAKDTLARMPECDGELLRRVDFEEEDIAAIAGELGRKETTLRGRLNRARARFQDMFGKVLKRRGDR